jgi:hypothetical protein
MFPSTPTSFTWRSGVSDAAHRSTSAAPLVDANVALALQAVPSVRSRGGRGRRRSRNRFAVVPSGHRQVLHRPRPRRQSLPRHGALIVQTPGFAQDENGRYHFRGPQRAELRRGRPADLGSDRDHVLQPIDPRILQSAEVIYGNIPRSTARRSRRSST